MPPVFSPSLNILDHITVWDWLVIVLFFAAIFGAVVYGQRLKEKEGVEGREQNFLDLMIMGRKLTLPLFVGTMVATWYGGILGVTSIAFESGIYNFVTQGLFWYAAYLTFAFFLIDKIQKYRALTMPDMITKQFGPASGKLSALFCFFDILPIAYVMSIGLFLQVIFPTAPLWALMIAGVALVMLYSTWGGFRSVVFSDFVFCITMCLAVVAVVAFSMGTLGLTHLSANLPAKHFSPMGGESLANVLVWGFIAMATLADPNFYQPVFSAESPRTAKKGLIVATFIWFCFDICTTLGGMYARASIPDAAPNTSYLVYAMQILPPGLRGLMLAGVAATIISTLDSMLFQAGATVAFDLVPAKHHHLRTSVKLHHLGVVACAALSIFLATQFEGNIKKVWKTLGSYQTACLLLPMMLGHVFPGKIRDRQFVLACVLGIVFTSLWKFSERQGFWANVDELYIGMLAALVGLGLYPLLFERDRNTKGQHS